MQYVIGGIGLAVFLLLLLLIGRFVFSWVMVASPDWKPRGLALIALEACYSATDPPLRLLRHVLPIVSVGHYRVDLAFLGLSLACSAVLSFLPLAQNG